MTIDNTTGDNLPLLSNHEDEKISAKRWMLLTNHLNFLYMMGAGLIMGPSGFYGKYYRDTLGLIPGWIPLFNDKIPKSLMAEVVAEGGHLRACRAYLDCKELNCDIFALNPNGEIRSGRFQDMLASETMAIFVPTPLPVSLLTEVHFNSAEDRDETKSRALDASNVDLSRLKLTVSTPAEADVSWPPAQELPLRDQDEIAGLAAAQARGGVLAMLSRFADRSDIGLAAFRVAFDRTPRPGDLATIGTDRILSPLPGWLSGEDVQIADDVPVRLFWGAVDCLAKGLENKTSLKPRNQILEFLRQKYEELPAGDKYKSRLHRLITHLREIAGGLPGGTTGDLLSQENGSFSRSLLLFFLKDSCEEFSSFAHELIGDSEYVLAAILFGASTGWQGLSEDMRGIDTQETFISIYMAECAARAESRRASFGNYPQRHVPWRELFEPTNGDWSTTQKAEALDISRKMNWDDCIRTHINLGRGSYQMKIDPAGLHFFLKGDIRAVETTVEMKTFMSRIHEIKVTKKKEKESRKLLEIEGDASAC